MFETVGNTEDFEFLLMNFCYIISIIYFYIDFAEKMNVITVTCMVSNILVPT